MKQRFPQMILPRFRPGDALTAERLNALAAAAEALGARRVLSRRADAAAFVPQTGAQSAAPFAVTLLDPKSPSKVRVNEGTVIGDGDDAGAWTFFPETKELGIEGDPDKAARVELRFNILNVNIYVDRDPETKGDTDNSGFPILRPDLKNPIELVYCDYEKSVAWQYWESDQDQADLKEHPLRVRRALTLAYIEKVTVDGQTRWAVRQQVRNDVFFPVELPLF